MASKNTSNFKIQQGLSSEYCVAEKLIGLGYDLVAHRFHTPFAEVDLVFKNKKNEFVLLEVKTLKNWAWMENRISRVQQLRLLRAAQWLQSSQKRPVHLAAAFVVQNKVLFRLISELI